MNRLLTVALDMYNQAGWQHTGRLRSLFMFLILDDLSMYQPWSLRCDTLNDELINKYGCVH
jgi:hypothetical protein